MPLVAIHSVALRSLRYAAGSLSLLLLVALCSFGPLGRGVAEAQNFFSADPITGRVFGAAVAGVGDLNHDGYQDFAVGDPEDDNPGTQQGRVFIYFGQAANLSTTPDLVLTAGTGGDEFGYSVVGLGHFNDDEYDDLAVGAPDNDGGGQEAGRVYVYFGGAGMDNVPDVTLTGFTGGDHFGWSLAGGFNYNGDGFMDLAVGAPDRSNLLQKAGEVRIFLGSSSPSTTAIVSLPGDQPQDQFGFSLHRAGHFNGDNFDDLVVGAPQQSQFNPGKAAVLFGRTGTGAPERLNLFGVNGTDRFGWSVGGGGNVNGDGYDDVIVGAPRHDAGATDNGSAYVFLGGSVNNAVPNAQIDGTLGGDHLGTSVALDGDYDKDGRDDAITGSPDANDGGSDSGRIDVWYGGNPVETGSPIALLGPVVAVGFPAGDHFGAAVAFVDYNGDGHAEVLGGAPDGNLPNGELRGLASLSFYPDTFVPITLTGFAAEFLDGQALLSWRLAGDDPALGFHVERQLRSGAAWQRRTTALLLPEGDGIWRFSDPLSSTDLASAGSTLAYRLVALGRDGGTTLFGPYAVTPEPPDGDRLLQNAPNPVPPSSSTRIRYQSLHPGQARLLIYDLAGRPVRRLFEAYVGAGWGEVTWDGNDDSGRALPGGAYFYRLELAGRILSHKLLLSR